MTDPFCRHLGTCGGCDVPYRPYAEQLASKERSLRALFPWARSERQHASDDIAPGGREARWFVPLYSSPGVVDSPRAFRQKIAFAFAPGARGRGLVMGHYAAGSQRVVPIDQCPVHSDRGNRIAFALRDALERRGIAAWPSRGVLRHVLVRVTRDEHEAVAMLVVSHNDKALRRPVRTLLDSDECPDGFFINTHDGPGPFMVGPTTLRVHGRTHVRETVGGFSYLVSPDAFFQTNVQAAEALQTSVLSAVCGAANRSDRQDRQDCVCWTCTCGSGLFSLPLAARGARVLAIEDNRQAIRDAEANVRLNRLGSASLRFVKSRVELAIERAARESWDVVILAIRPAPAVRALSFAPWPRPSDPGASCTCRVILRHWRRSGSSWRRPEYHVERVEAVDMFPHTSHIEAVVTCVRQ